MAGKKEPAKNADTADAAAAPEGGGKKGKLLKMMIILLVVAAAGGGGAYWYLGQSKSGKAAEAKPQPPKPPVYVALETFTVNLQVEENPQFLQAGLSLKVADNAVVDNLKLHMPEVRDKILILLSARKPSELLTVEGKRKLGTDIVDVVNNILVPPSPKAKKKKPAKAPPPEEKSADEEPAADGEEKPDQEAEAPPPPPKPVLPVISVLFTSFIVQ